MYIYIYRIYIYIYIYIIHIPKEPYHTTCENANASRPRLVQQPGPLFFSCSRLSRDRLADSSFRVIRVFEESAGRRKTMRAGPGAGRAGPIASELAWCGACC